MKYIGGIITSYIVLLVLDIMQRRNHKRTQSLKKFKNFSKEVIKS